MRVANALEGVSDIAALGAACADRVDGTMLVRATLGALHFDYHPTNRALKYAAEAMPARMVRELPAARTARRLTTSWRAFPFGEP